MNDVPDLRAGQLLDELWLARAAVENWARKTGGAATITDARQ